MPNLMKLDLKGRGACSIMCRRDTHRDAPILTTIACLVPDKEQSTMKIARAYEWLNDLSRTLHGQELGELWRSKT